MDAAKPSWQVLQPGLYRASAQQPGADPMWVWADATQYREHRPFDPEAGVAAVVDHGAGAKPRFAGACSLSTKRVAALVESGARLELGMPTIPLRPRRPTREPDTARPEGKAPSSTKELLVAVIDSGCPFASRMLRDRDGRTRVLALWDQDPNPSFGSCGGHRPAGLGYGCAVGREALDALMRKATDRHGHVDEASCYRLAQYDAVLARASHGAAVLSQLLGAPIHGGALQPEPGRPPMWDEAGVAVDDADVVFVQLARDAIQDSTSAGLARSVVDGLRFVLERATPGTTKRIVVCVSNGTSRGAHDASSLVERAMNAWIDEAGQLGIDASIVVPIGNTHDEQRHAVLSDAGHALELMIPPAVEMPQYVTMRCPGSATDKVVLKVTPPGGATSRVACGQALGWPDAHVPSCGVVWVRPVCAEASTALIAIAPTSHSTGAAEGSAMPTASAGRWRIEIGAADGADDLELDEPVCFWISRNQRNPGALARSRQAYFVDHDQTYEPALHLRARHDVEDARLRNGIRRAGAMSGLSTLSRSDRRFVVVGGYVLASGEPARPSDYSAAGPSAGDRAGRREGPDVTAPADTAAATPGMSVRGNLSGAIVRMRGTSFAAPLFARASANGITLQDLAGTARKVTRGKGGEASGKSPTPSHDVQQRARLGVCLTVAPPSSRRPRPRIRGPAPEAPRADGEHGDR
jgi:hypothetical protein